ncbi:twin-arginine translocase subunit TatB [Arcobacter sp. F155]|uniref:Sec-independent protein translocase protein TatB n=1 Tax=Arcobacteraceae TaxID=2808963 RepID=UPI00100BAC5D|nr:MULTISPECIES: Sec-independent protein translocase protein TatB [unclassified Arcobacter]RXJ76171.1 twin-arginine translocase subunit TatB [Arcobacter sp. F155]RXJ99844.1 twin-arginine translocase subunit TatB [Arcobacter sp. CECT 8989]
MFGMGFMEIFLIAVVAIIALGPDKLPTAMVEIAKFIKKFKSGIEDAKSTLDNELNINEMKEEAAKYKAQIEDAKNTLNVKENMNLDLDNILSDDNEPSKVKEDSKKEAKEDEVKEQVSLKEPKKKKKKENSDKFKVNFDEEIKEEK